MQLLEIPSPGNLYLQTARQTDGKQDVLSKDKLPSMSGVYAWKLPISTLNMYRVLKAYRDMRQLSRFVSVQNTWVAIIILLGRR